MSSDLNKKTDVERWIKVDGKEKHFIEKCIEY